MENMESKIMDVLNDPEKLAEIMQIAQNLGFSPSAAEEAPASDDSAMTGTLLRLLGSMQNTGGRQDALLGALMPYLKPQRQKKLRRAMQVAKLSHLAGYALKNYSDFTEER